MPITGRTERLKYTKQHVTLYPCCTATYKALATQMEQMNGHTQIKQLNTSVYHYVERLIIRVGTTHVRKQHTNRTEQRLMKITF